MTQVISIDGKAKRVTACGAVVFKEWDLPYGKVRLMISKQQLLEELQEVQDALDAADREKPCEPS